jgi:hypothetical protein
MKKQIDQRTIRYVKAVPIGSINPNLPFSDKEREKQVAVLNRYLNEIPRGMIIGQDKSVATYDLAGHQIIMEKTTYHVGFERKPVSFDEEQDIVYGQNNPG